MLHPFHKQENRRMKTTVDVVIIGAGVIGCSTAYHLTQIGIPDVAVVEMDQVGSGSSGKSASMLSLQYCEDDLTIQMTKYSYNKYMQFEEEMGVPIDFKKIGWISIASEKSMEPLLRNAKLLNSYGITTEMLEPDEIKRRYPEINTEDLVLGAWGPDDGLILNCGWGGRGIIQAPIAGRLVAETICNGYPSAMDIHPLKIERFKGTFLDT